MTYTVSIDITAPEIDDAMLALWRMVQTETTLHTINETGFSGINVKLNSIRAMHALKPDFLKKSEKVFSYNDIRKCVRHYANFACAVPGEEDAEQIELIRGWIEEYRPNVFRKLFPKKGGAQ